MVVPLAIWKWLSVCLSGEGAGADPALVVGGGAISLDGGADPIYFRDFRKSPMKIKKFWSVGGCASGAPPLDLPLGGECINFVFNSAPLLATSPQRARGQLSLFNLINYHYK